MHFSSFINVMHFSKLEKFLSAQNNSKGSLSWFGDRYMKMDLTPQLKTRSPEFDQI